MFDDSSFVSLAMSEDQGRADAALLVRFELVEVEDPEATKANGYTSYKPREFVRIRIPGTQEERVHKVKQVDRLRFPRAYAAFKSGQADAIQGTSLKECPVLNATEVSMFNHHGAMSVEQVAALSDENISNMGHGIRPVRDRVKAWAEARKSQAPVAALHAQLKEKDAQLAALSERLAALETRDGAPTLNEAPKPKRIRKPKAKQPAAES